MSMPGSVFHRERRPRTAAPLRIGVQKMLNNQSALTHQAGMGVTCPICCTRFYRAPSHVARVGVAYCSRGCQNEGAKVRIETRCVTCGKLMEQTPSNAQRVVTCSKECSTIRKQNGNLLPSSPMNTAAWRQHVMEVRAHGVCARCGQNHGPWVVRISGDLLCRVCHLTDIAQSGGLARQRGLV